jgi:hypothetical protein
MLWIENYFDLVDLMKSYPPIFGGELPRGFASLASITVEVVPEPA